MTEFGLAALGSIMCPAAKAAANSGVGPLGSSMPTASERPAAASTVGGIDGVRGEHRGAERAGLAAVA